MRSDDSGWAARTLSEVEEQLERNRVPQWSSWLAILGLVTVVLLLLTPRLSIRQSALGTDPAGAMWLTTSDLERLEEIANQNRLITEEELREIFTRQLTNVLRDRRPKPTTNPGQEARFLLTAVLPVLILPAVLGF